MLKFFLFTMALLNVLSGSSQAITPATDTAQVPYVYVHPGYYLPFNEEIQSTASKYSREGFLLIDTLDKTTLLSLKNFPVILSAQSDSTFRITVFALNPFTGNDELLLRYSLFSDTCLYSLTLDSVVTTDYSQVLNSKHEPVSNGSYGYANAILFLQTLKPNHFRAYKAAMKREKEDSKLWWFGSLFHSLGLTTSDDLENAQPAGQLVKQIRRIYKPEEESIQPVVPIVIPEEGEK